MSQSDNSWKNLVGERVLVFMSPYSLTPSDRIVTDYADGFVEFDDEDHWHESSGLKLYSVHSSKRFPLGWDWD